jgi:1-aminocyclopropane-1-carboxylate deaminase/D-cysteine desulfhydrase-like pyridoxal-dependent ACC family enzyme
MTQDQNSNAKLDEILEQNRTIFGLLNGEKGGLGLLQKVEIMWRFHVWVLCTASAGAGAALYAGIKHFI